MTRKELDQLADDPKQLKELLWRYIVKSDELKFQFLLLKRRHYGCSSEKTPCGQQVLDFGAEPDVTDLPEPKAAEAKTEESKPAAETAVPDAGPKGKPGRRRPPADWPRERVEHELPEAERKCDCCGKVMEKFGEETSEEVDIVPAQVKVLLHVRHKYACKGCQEGVRTAPGPAKVVEGGAASAGMVAAVIVEKYGDHKPLYRQSVSWARVGQEISRGTLCGWVGQGAERLRPLYDWMKLDVIKSLILNTDDTTVRVLEPGTGKTRLGRFWEYDGDDRHPWTVWDYTANRKRAGPEDFLKGYKGSLQADAYQGYDRLYGELILEIACWAHSRRKFIEAQETDLRAEEILELIRRLYVVEAEARPWVMAARERYYATWVVSGPTAEGEAELAAAYERRRKLREERSRPVMVKIEAWLAGREKDSLPQSPLGLAVQYARNQWAALQRYIQDGRLEIDNNRAENVLRRAALGRKNWLFVGSDAGGERAAILYTMLSTCARHLVNPWLWMKDVLLRISTHPASKIEELLPLNWKKLFASR